MATSDRPRPCLLCAAEPLTERYYSDGRCWVADCSTCAVPMVVHTYHTDAPADADVEAMLALLGTVADARFGAGGWWLDPLRRSIPDHWHAHARPRHGFFGADR